TGADDLAGSLSVIETLLRAFQGGVTPTGALTNDVGIARVMTGAITSSGSIVKNLPISLSGETFLAGTSSLQTKKVLVGELVSQGSYNLLNTLFLNVVGVLTPEGVFTPVRAVLRDYSGEIVPSGEVVRSIVQLSSGTLVISG